MVVIYMLFHVGHTLTYSAILLIFLMLLFSFSVNALHFSQSTPYTLSILHINKVSWCIKDWKKVLTAGFNIPAD